MKKNRKKFVSIRRAAKVWGMSEAALRRRIHSGLIEAVSDPASRRRRAVLLIEGATVGALRAARWCSQEEETRACCAQEAAVR